MTLISIEGRTRKAAINREVIELLRNWLKQAEAGELTGIAIAGSRSDGSAATEIVKTDDFHTLNSAVSVLQFRMLDECRMSER